MNSTNLTNDYKLGTINNRNEEIMRHSHGFSLESPVSLRCVVSPEHFVWAKIGSMIAYYGHVDFSREGLFEGGLKHSLLRKISSHLDSTDNIHLMKCQGKGFLYLAHARKHVSIFYLQNESICFDGEDLLAFESTLHFEHRAHHISIRSTNTAAGSIPMALSGTGWVALLSMGSPLCLTLTSQYPLFTDGNATIAWSSTATYSVHRNVKLKSLFGRESGEESQLEWKGHGIVLCQPYE